MRSCSPLTAVSIASSRASERRALYSVCRVVCAVGAGSVGVRGVLGTPTEQRLSQTSATWTGAAVGARRPRPRPPPLHRFASELLPPLRLVSVCSRRSSGHRRLAPSLQISPSLARELLPTNVQRPSSTSPRSRRRGATRTTSRSSPTRFQTRKRPRRLRTASTRSRSAPTSG